MEFKVGQKMVMSVGATKYLIDVRAIVDGRYNSL